MINPELEYRALKILEQHPDLTQRQLAEKLGISLGKTHYLIKSLIDVGWVKLDNFQKSNNKWGYATANANGYCRENRNYGAFFDKKQREYNALKEEIAQLKDEVRSQSLLPNKIFYVLGCD